MVPDAINILSALVLVLLVGAYGSQGPKRIQQDLRDLVLSPFVALPAITGMLLAAALGRYALGAGRDLVIVFLLMTVAVGGWLTGQWIVGDLEQDSLHPGHFLPTVAGGLIGAYSSAQVDLHLIAEASFGIGLVCWFLIGSMLLGRLLVRPMLPPPLLPTMAIELAPPAVAGIAYFAIDGGVTNGFACALGGYAVLMALVQLRLLPLYARLPFGPGFWAFTFSMAAAATDALVWIALKKPPGATAYAITVLVVVTVFVATILARTVVLIADGRLLSRSSVQTERTAP